MPGPLDVNINLPRTIETQRIEPIRQGQIVTEQQERSRKMQEEVKIQQQQVQTSTETSAQIKVKQQDGKKKNKNKEKKYRNYRSSGQIESVVEEDEEHKIDIKI